VTVAVAIPQDLGEHLQCYDDSVMYGYDNEYDGLDCYHDAYALEGDSDKVFAQVALIISHPSKMTLHI